VGLRALQRRRHEVSAREHFTQSPKKSFHFAPHDVEMDNSTITVPQDSLCQRRGCMSAGSCLLFGTLVAVALLAATATAASAVFSGPVACSGRCMPGAARKRLAASVAFGGVALSLSQLHPTACSGHSGFRASAAGATMALRGGAAHALMEMPPIMYGTAWKKDRTEDLVLQAVRLGFRGIDTACQPKHYYEPGVGAALRRLEQEGVGRDSLFIQTKYTPIRGQVIDMVGIVL